MHFALRFLALGGIDNFWFEEELDGTRNNVLFVKYRLSADGMEVREFVIIYWHIVDGKNVEIIRFDCCEKESLNVHTFYTATPEKRFLNRDKIFETIEEIIGSIRKNWRHIS